MAPDPPGEAPLPPPLPPYPPGKAPHPPPPYPPGKAPKPPPPPLPSPNEPVADPTLPQKTGEGSSPHWWLALLGIAAVLLLFGGATFCCFRPQLIGAAAVNCDEEPDKRNKKEYERWERECEERRRRASATKSKLSLTFSDADITRYHAIQT